MIGSKVFISWLGRDDLDAEDQKEYGPLALTLFEAYDPFYEVCILAYDWLDEVPRYLSWLKSLLASCNPKLMVSHRELTPMSPDDHESIYVATCNAMAPYLSKGDEVTLNIASNGPAMKEVWLLISKDTYCGGRVKALPRGGMAAIEGPSNSSPDNLQRQEGSLGPTVSAATDIGTHFDRIQTSSPAMKVAVSLAKKLAVWNRPVIIQGESGTGKAVLAKALHNTSLRCPMPFVAVNCGAIPESLIEPYFFGERKTSYTTGSFERQGFFQEAKGGTLFLDDVGALSLETQAKLLNVLLDKKVMPVGATKAQVVDVRVIVGTHRDLLEMVEKGKFREDLFYQLAEGIIHLPPLRDRLQEIPCMVSELLQQLNEDAKNQPRFECKDISDNAIEFIRKQAWPGNIPELRNTLIRAYICSEGTRLEVEHIRQAIIHRSPKARHQDLKIDINQGVNIYQILDDTKRYCINEALRITAGQKGRAATLLGLKNHQTLVNWMKLLDIDPV